MSQANYDLPGSVAANLKQENIDYQKDKKDWQDMRDGIDEMLEELEE